MGPSRTYLSQTQPYLCHGTQHTHPPATTPVPSGRSTVQVCSSRSFSAARPSAAAGPAGNPPNPALTLMLGVRLLKYEFLPLHVPPVRMLVLLVALCLTVFTRVAYLLLGC